MTVRVEDAASVPSQLEFLERLGCHAVRKGPTTFDVDLRETIDAEQGRLLIALFLAAWRTTVVA